MTSDNSTTFRRMHRDGAAFLLANAWDYASAAALVATGFPAIGTTSLGVAAAVGLPDAAGQALDATRALARILSRLPVPVTVDMEGGFSDEPEEVAGFAAELAAMGIAGINIEDGRPDGSLRDVPEQCAILRAIKAKVPDLFLNARTDAYWLGIDDRPPQPEAVRRVQAYAGAGADGVFVPSAPDDASIAGLVAAVPLPLNILFAPGRHTVEHLTALGVRRISMGSLLFRTALAAAVQTAVAVRDGEPLPIDNVPSYAEVQAWC
jgi:2-methylisocitrate lyase-like PEP mutase family enzyme